MTKAKIKFYQCRECGLKYKEKFWADKCEIWCREKSSCNLEIVKHALETKNKN